MPRHAKVTKTDAALYWRPPPPHHPSSNNNREIVNFESLHFQLNFYLLLFPPPPPPFPYFFFPKLKGIYLYLIICCICLFIVTENKINQYSNKIGQKTGTSNAEKNVAINPTVIERMLAYQNLNSGSRRTNGLNSSSDFDGSVGSSSC